MIRRSTLRGWLIAFAAFFAALYLLRGMLLPFVTGLAFAYFLDPLADRMVRLGMKRTPAVVAIIFSAMTVIVSLLVVLIPVIQVQVMSLIENGPGYADRAWQAIHPHVLWVLDHLPEEQVKSVENAAGSYAGNLVNWSGGLARGILSRGFAVVSVLSFCVVTPVVTFYLLRDWDRMMTLIDGWLPREHAPIIRAMAHDIDLTLSGFLRGQATVCLALAVYYGLGLSIAGLEAGLLVGIGTGLFSFIPYVGGIAGFVVGVVLALVQFTDWPSILGVVAVFCGGQFLEGYVLVPRLVGNKVGLHPVWVLFSLFAGAALFGFLGILVALPVAAAIGVLARYALRRYLVSDVYRGETGGDA
ncbi:AI-2E family transporter [Oleispirillum naphthae]|uniref:AI-2E family transporter n=1 Tax=Oleispirillum naphthae TaxID=2838853 RepID=UPI0030824DB0